MRTNSPYTNELIKITGKEYPLFAEYCYYLNEGLRKDALKSLDEFLKITLDWDYLTKVAFCKTIFCTSSNANNDINQVLTTQLKDNLIKPSLLEMMDKEPDNYLSFKWYGQYFQDISYLKHAYELASSDNSLKLMLLNELEHAIWLSTHHLPEQYIGNIDEDECNLKLAFSIMDSLETQLQNNYFKRFNEYRNLIAAYKTHKE